MESNQVPLVVYNNMGKRTVVGMARVDADGAIHAIVAKDRWPELKGLMFDSLRAEFVVATSPEIAPKPFGNPFVPLRPAEKSYLDRLVNDKMLGVKNNQNLEK